MEEQGITDSNSIADMTTGEIEASSTKTKQKKSTLLSQPIFWFFLLLLIAIFIAGIYYTLHIFNDEITKESTEGTHVQTIIDRSQLVVGTDATYPPMESVSDDGTIIGYDIDLANKIAQELGVSLSVENIAWDDLFQALVNGQVDIVIAGVSITEERKILYAFSEPYLNAGQVIITQKDNSFITSTNDLTGKKIGVQKETTNEEEALKYTDSDLVIGYDNFDLATQALVKGDVDAIFSDLTNAKSITTANQTLKIASDPFTSDYYGIVIRKSEDDLKEKIDLILNTLRQRGVLTLLKQKWLD